MRDTRVMGLPDGRELAWLELGDAANPAVFVFHGSPGSRLQVSFDEGPVEAARVRSIAVDRPGYGHSSFQRDRRLADWASDISRLADHLHLDRFSVVGISGGGPHAAACARFLPDRVRAAGIVSGVGPLAAPGSEDEMMGLNRLITRLARRSPVSRLPTLLGQRFALSPMAGKVDTGQPPVTPPPRTSTSCAAQLCGRPISIPTDVPPRPVLSLRRKTSPSSHPWGFRLEDIAVPVHVWHGDEDRNVPLAHGRLQAERIPGARLHECPGQGHLLALDRLEEILRTVSVGGA